MGSFLHTPVDGGHASLCVTSTHKALDQLPAEGFSAAQWGSEPKVIEGRFKTNSLSSIASWDILFLKGDVLAFSHTTYIRGLFYFCTLLYDKLKSQNSTLSLNCAYYSLFNTKYGHPLSQLCMCMRGCATMTTIWTKKTVGSSNHFLGLILYQT